MSLEQNRPSAREIYAQTDGESLAQVHEELDAFLADAEVGTTKFAAFSDFVSYREIFIDITDLQAYPTLTETNKSDMREYEVTLGTLNAHILIEKGRTPGYASAYTKSNSFRERLERAYDDKDNVKKANYDLRHRRDTISEQTPPDRW